MLQSYEHISEDNGANTQKRRGDSGRRSELLAQAGCCHCGKYGDGYTPSKPMRMRVYS